MGWGWGWVAHGRAEVWAGLRTRALIALGLLFLQESTKKRVLQAWSPEISQSDSVLHASPKKKPFEWQQINKVLIQLLNFFSDSNLFNNKGNENGNKSIHLLFLPVGGLAFPFSPSLEEEVVCQQLPKARKLG